MIWPELLLTATLALPPLLALALLVPGWVRRLALALAPWSALPAVALGLQGARDETLTLPWLLLGSRFGVDETGAVFLLLTGILWLLAGIYATSYVRHGRGRYFAYHLVTLTGNLGLVLAHDTVSFYLMFVIMTLAAFGLIVHEGTNEARYAGLVYLVMAIAGEGLLLFGLVLGAAQVGGTELPSFTASDVGTGASVLLLLGFGVKAGLPLLHMWLPLAHPQAPTPASAVLSGAMIKAGLLGWLRFLPLGVVPHESLGAFVVIAGLAAAFLAALAGVLQHRPKALLAYSSVSQMGYMTVAVGAALVVPRSAVAVVAAVSLFAFHHALTKGALFLGAGLAERLPGQRRTPRTLLMGGLVLAAAVLAGLPLTGGALAKSLLKEAAQPVAEIWGWTSFVPTALTAAAVGTSLLMLRFLALIWRQVSSGGSDPAGAAADGGANGRDGWALWAPWLFSLLLVAGAAPRLASIRDLPLLGIADIGFSSEGLAHGWELLWPLLLALLLYFLLLRGNVPELPPGDVLVPLSTAGAWLYRSLRPAAATVPMLLARLLRGWNSQRRRLGTTVWLPVLERNLMRWDSAGLLLLALGALFFVALWRSANG